MAPPRLLAVLALPLLVLAASAAGPASARPSGDAAAYADATGAFAADFSYDGWCDGAGIVTLVIHRPGGPEVRTAHVTSTAPTGVCGAGLSCMDCPPVPTAYAWTLKGTGVLLVGGGPAAYYQYQETPLAYSLSGTFQGGALEAAGTIL